MSKFETILVGILLCVAEHAQPINHVCTGAVSSDCVGPVPHPFLSSRGKIGDNSTHPPDTAEKSLHPSTRLEAAPTIKVAHPVLLQHSASCLLHRTSCIVSQVLIHVSALPPDHELTESTDPPVPLMPGTVVGTQ